jgi:hypothetical protein
MQAHSRPAGASNNVASALHLSDHGMLLTSCTRRPPNPQPMSAKSTGLVICLSPSPWQCAGYSTLQSTHLLIPVTHEPRDAQRADSHEWRHGQCSAGGIINEGMHSSPGTDIGLTGYSNCGSARGLACARERNFRFLKAPPSSSSATSTAQHKQVIRSVEEAMKLNRTADKKEGQPTRTLGSIKKGF